MRDVYFVTLLSQPRDTLDASGAYLITDETVACDPTRILSLTNFLAKKLGEICWRRCQRCTEVKTSSKPAENLPGMGPILAALELMNKTLICLAAVSMVISTVLSRSRLRKKELTGVWEVKISPTGVPPPPMLSVAMFGKDGSFVGTHDRAVPPVPEILAIGTDMGPAYGRWVQSGNREFQLTFYAAMWNKEGVICGFHRIQASLVLSESGDEFTAKTQADFSDANWKTVMSNTGGGERHEAEKTPDEK